MRNFKITIICFLLLQSNNLLLAQEEWELPIVKDKIVFEFNSQVIPGKTDLCELYTSIDFMTAVSLKCQKIYLNSISKQSGGIVRKTKNNQIYPTLYGTTSGITSTIPKCIKGKADTLTGSLRIVCENSSYFSGFKGGEITCMYRIILLNDKINVKFKGFEITASKDRNGISINSNGTLGAAKSLETESRPLEEEYKNMQTKKSDKEFWLDFKNLIGAYYDIIESELTRRRGGVDFDE